MEEKDLILITDEEAGTRLDKILATRYGARSRTYFQNLINEGKVLLNGQQVKKRTAPEIGDEVEILFTLSPDADIIPENIPLEILYEDEAILVINKPAGMVVHPAPGNWNGTFVNALLYHCKELSNTSTPLRPGIVHRLDKETSGLLVAAKTEQAQQRLIEAFSGRQVQKKYIGICVGHPGNGVIEAPIGRHPTKRKEMSIVEKGRLSTTAYKTLAFDGKLSLVEFDLITGRTHQIRVHMKHRGTPILGDSTYGSPSTNERYGVQRQLLHAHKLQLKHPMSGNLLSFIANIPPDIEEMKLKIEKNNTL